MDYQQWRAYVDQTHGVIYSDLFELIDNNDIWCGGYYIKIPYHRFSSLILTKEFANIEEWCNLNCQGKHNQFFHYWGFQYYTDAIMFKLVWY